MAREESKQKQKEILKTIIPVYGEAWVDTHDGEKFSNSVLFIKEKDCLKLSEYPTSGFHIIAESEEKEVDSYIDECYMRYLPKGSEDSEYEGACWIVCEKGRGASKFLYASVEYSERK